AADSERALRLLHLAPILRAPPILWRSQRARGQESISMIGPMANSLSGVKIFTKATID
ncbi:hypothetical protein BD779DRAFT_1769673, partial [Infundibulicybe gibba]